VGDDDYRPFRDVAQRNFTQALFEVPLMVRMLGLPRGKRLLEVGCGRGNAMSAFNRMLQPRFLVGIDIDRGLLVEADKSASARGISADLVQGDARWMPFRSAAFDLVIDFGTCYHIARPHLALTEVQRILSDGGTFAYETPANQLLSHPMRSFGRSLPWGAGELLRPHRRRMLWSSRVKVRQAAEH
jgi:ubiquinone/menaquinone biosynthesis C-methylase UbiE